MQEKWGRIYIKTKYLLRTLAQKFLGIAVEEIGYWLQRHWSPASLLMGIISLYMNKKKQKKSYIFY